MKRIGIYVVLVGVLHCLGGSANWVELSLEGRGETYGILTGLMVLQCGDAEEQSLGEEYRRVLEETVADGELVDGLVSWVCWGEPLERYWAQEGGFRMEEGACAGVWESSFACFVLGMCGEREYLGKAARWLAEQPMPEEPLPYFLRLHGLLLAESVLGERISTERERDSYRSFCSGKLSVLQTAIACHCGALLGDWETAWRLRNQLLALALVDHTGWNARAFRGNWGDLVATAYAVLALREFRRGEIAGDVDLFVPVEGIRCMADRRRVRAIVFQQGTGRSSPFEVEAYWILEDGTERFWGRSRVDGLDAGESALVQIGGDAPPLNARGMMLVVDSRGETKDVNRSNNRVVFYWQKGVAVGELTIDGGQPDVVFCGGGRYAVVEGTVFASTGECRWRLLDNGAVLAEGEGAGAFSCDWQGKTGEHLLTLRVEKEDEVAMAEVRVTVVEGTAHLQCDKERYGCREYVTFIARKAFPEWKGRVVVRDATGKQCGSAVAVGEEVFQWHTGTCSPGMYKGTVECFLSGTQAVTATAEASFEIEPMALRTDTRILAPEQNRMIFEGESFQTELVVQWKELVNDGSATMVEWQWCSEEGTLLRTGSWVVPANRGEYLRESRGMVSLSFPEAGEYRLTVDIGGTATECRFTASPLPVLSVSAEVIPAYVGQLPVSGKTVVHLNSESGEISGSRLASCEVKEAPALLTDAADLEEDGTITLWKFRRKDGSVVQEGEFIATVAYGELEGDFAWEGVRRSGATVGVKIQDGEAVLRYRPLGRYLLPGERATLLVRLFSTEGVEVGKVELFLRGEER